MSNHAFLLLAQGLWGNATQLVADYEGAELAGLIDPDESRDALAKRLGCKRYASLDKVPPAMGDAAIIATPNGDHLTTGLDCAARMAGFDGKTHFRQNG